MKRHEPTLTREMKRFALSSLRSDDIGPNGDPWGSGMGHLFAIANTLDHINEVPYHWQYSAPMGSDVADIVECANNTPEGSDPHWSCQCDYTQVGYVPFLDAGPTGAALLTYAGNVINRYLNFVQRAGRDY